MEVAVGVTKSFNVTVRNYCDWNYTTIEDVIMSKTLLGVDAGNLTLSSIDPSVTYVSMIWTPQWNQIGLQKLCFIAYTE